jgi:8-oxo-dGTP diphosphatase
MAKDGKKSERRDADRPKQRKPGKKRNGPARAVDAAPDGPGGYVAGDRPAVALVVDVTLFAVDRGALVVLLVERRRAPDSGRWAVPGAVVEPDETLTGAATRAVVARTGILEPFGRAEQLAVFDAPGRDPRTRVVSSTVLAVASTAVPPAGGALASGRWWPVDVIGTDDGPAMAFDHLDIVTTGVERLRSRLEHSDLATALVDEPFTIGDLRRVYEAAWGDGLEPANFRRKVLATPGLVAQTAGTRTVGTGRPAELYVRGVGAVLHPPMPRPG